MLYLYDKNTIDFTNNGEPIRHSYDEHVIREDGFYLTFKLLLDINSDYKKVKKEMIVSAETPDGRNQFRVYNIVKRKDHVEVVAVQLMYDLDNKMVNPFKVNKVSGTTAINRFISSFKSSLGAFTLSSSVAETHDFSTNDENDDTPSHNALEVLNRITNRWDSELLVNGYDIRMIKRLGTRTNALLYEKKNISSFEDESTVRNMATRIHATSRFIAEGDDEETVISVSVDSPLINEYAQVYEKSFVNNDARTTQELVNWVNLKYSTENIDKPKRNINVSTNIIDGTEINYGDELVLKYLVHDVDEVIRCVGYDYNPVAQTYYSITLGGWKDTFLNTVTNKIVDTTNRQINQLKQTITYVSMAANGKNRIAYGPDPVPNPIKGDLWIYYEWDRPDEQEMRIYQDGFWESMDFAVKKDVENAISKAEAAQQAAENAYNDAVAEADRLVTAETTRVDAIIETVNADILNVKNNADSALSSIDTAIANAGFTSLDATLANITSIGNQAKADASTALSQAQSAVAVAGGVSGRVTTVENSVDSINGVLVNKVSTVDFNNLTGRVGIAETAIAQHDSAISLRATKTEAQGYAQDAVDGLEVGGRNYFKNYDGREVSVSNSTTDEYYVYPSNSGAPVAIELEPNTTYTMSGQFKVNVTTYRTLDMFFVHSPVSGITQHRSAVLFPLTTQYVKHQFTFTTGDNPSQRGYGRFDLNGSTDPTLITMFAKFLKLEKGNKATDWTPSPEDVDAAISSVQSNLTVEAGKISAVTARVSGTESSIASVKQTADGNSATVASHTGQISMINQTVNGLQSTVADKADKSQITQLSNSISSVVTNLNNLEVGGRNLFENTKTMSNMPYLYTEKYGAFSTVSSKPPSGYIDTYTYITPILEGLEHTVSFYAKADVNMNMVCHFYSPNTTTYAISSTGQASSIQDGTIAVSVTTQWKRYWVTWKQSKDGDAKSVIVGRNTSTNRLFIAGVKFEKGNKATDWTPAPEDMASQSQITQLSNLINLRVTSGDVTAAILADKRIKDTRTTNELPSGYFTNYPSQRVEEFKDMTVIGVPGALGYAKLVTDIPWADPSGGAVVQNAYSSDGVYTRSSNAAGTAWGAWVKQTDSANVLAQVNLSTEGVLIQGKRIQLDGDVTMTAAYVTKLNTQTLTAITANIASIRTSILAADVITSGMVATSTALITKIFATDATVTTLTGKTAFINSIKAITISADKITAGTLNAANVNIINLNADRISSGTVSGANSAWNLNTGRMNFKNPSTNDDLVFTQGQIEFTRGNQTRLLKYNAEGLVMEPMSTNTGTSLNTSIHLNGGVDYIQFNNRLGTTKFGRLEIGSNNAKLEIPVGVEFGIVDVNNVQAPITANYFKTVHSTGHIIYMQQNRIYTIHDHLARNIYLEPNGVGSVVVGDGGGTRWNIVASDFVKQSTRESKMDISPIVEKGLDVINRLVPVRYKKKDKVAQGIIETELGFIAEDSPEVASPDGQGIYDSHITAYLVKGVQEMDLEIKQLKQKIAELERNIA